MNVPCIMYNLLYTVDNIMHFLRVNNKIYQQMLHNKINIFP